MKEMKLWYLAHPVTPDEEHTFEDNLAHTCKMLRLCHTFGFYAVAPWYGMVEAYKDARGSKAYAVFREFGLSMDEANVDAYGRIILTGHKLSEGMSRELGVIASSLYNHSDRVINLVGMTDEEARKTLKMYASIVDDRIQT